MYESNDALFISDNSINQKPANLQIGLLDDYPSGPTYDRNSYPDRICFKSTMVNTFKIPWIITVICDVTGISGNIFIIQGSQNVHMVFCEIEAFDFGRYNLGNV